MSFPSILVADNEPEHAELLSEILIDAGYPHVVVPVEELWPLVSQAIPGLLLLGVSLGSTTGWTVVERMRCYPPTETLPVILCTTQAGPFTQQASALQSQHCSIVAKPFDICELLVLIADLLGPPPAR